MVNLAPNSTTDKSSGNVIGPTADKIKSPRNHGDRPLITIPPLVADLCGQSDNSQSIDYQYVDTIGENLSSDDEPKGMQKIPRVESNSQILEQRYGCKTVRNRLERSRDPIDG